MDNLAKVIALGGRRLNRALAMHYLFSEQGTNGYIPLAYIESTGTQYIDTGIKPSDDMVFEIEYQVMEDIGSGRKLFGCEVGGSSMFNAFKVKKASAAIRAFAGNGAGENGVVTAINTNADQKTELKVEIKDGKYTVSVDDVSYPQADANGTAPDLNIYLFAVNRLRGGTTFADAPISARIYSCKIYKSGALVGDFRPCIAPDGKVGMYDAVTKQFYGNAAGDGEAFTPSPVLDDYVHDSANLILDGIWNSAEGVHSDTLAEGWVDLSGNCQPTPLGTGNTVGENCITSDGTGNGRMTVPDLDPINLDTFTLEVLFKINGNVDANQVIIGRLYTKSYYINTWSNNLAVWLGGKQNRLDGIINGTDKFLVQITHTGSSFSVWLDGVKVISNISNTILTDTSKLNLFGHSGNNTTFMGSIFAIRLHNRVLTDAEIAQNYEVDKERFGLTETASVMMLGMPAETLSMGLDGNEEQIANEELEVTEDDSI